MIDSAFDFRRNGRIGISLPELALVVLLHAVVVWLLLSLDVMPRPVQRKPIMVRIIPPQIPAMGSGSMPAETQAPPQPQPVKPPEPPKAPKPVPPAKKVLRPRPPMPVPPAPKAPAQEILAAPPVPAAATSENAVTAPPPDPVDTAESEGGSGAASGQGSGLGGSGSGGGSGGEGTQPRFDADYLHNPRPVYPPMSRRMGEEGKVFLRVRVEADGRPSQVEIKTSSGSPRLDQAAEDAVRRWRFIPAKRGGEAVSAWVIVPISFNLK